MLNPANGNPRHVMLRRDRASESTTGEVLAPKVSLPWEIPQERDVMKRAEKRTAPGLAGRRCAPLNRAARASSPCRRDGPGPGGRADSGRDFPPPDSGRRWREARPR